MALALISASIASVGCASPGQPKPPSLRLPQIVQDLSVRRIGNTVLLRWTTPAATTDNLPAPAGLIAVICRQKPGSSAAPACIPTEQFAVKAGPVERAEVLSPYLATDPVTLLGFRVEVLNDAGRSAGPSDEAFAAGGASPQAPLGLRATPLRHAVRLEWSPKGGGAVIELDRLDLSPPSGTGTTSGPAPPPSHKASAEVHLRAQATGALDPGGMIDRTVAKSGKYRYTAQRVRTVAIGGHTLELRSDVSPPVDVSVLNTFPPVAPAGLEASPDALATGAIDLSWTPEAEPDLAGYNVYRVQAGVSGKISDTDPAAWKRLNSVLVALPAYKDADARPGVSYVYHVTAVDADGNESAPGNKVQETLGTR